MKTLLSTRTRAAGSVWRARVCAVGLLISGAPALAATSPAPVSSADSPALTEQGQVPTVPGAPAPAPASDPRSSDPTLPREPNPTGIELPDEVSAQELKGEYGLGLGLLILGGVLVAGVVIGLLTVLMRRSWSGT